jgi:hypothetical protein
MAVMSQTSMLHRYQATDLYVQRWHLLQDSALTEVLQVLATADDFGLVKLFDYPATGKFAKFKKYIVCSDGDCTSDYLLTVPLGPFGTRHQRAVLSTRPVLGIHRWK